MFSLHSIGGSAIAATAAAGGGFTAADLARLAEVRAVAMARRQWSRGEVVSNEFSHYLVAWTPQNDPAGPPLLALARFKRTGTYALTVGSMVVASGRSLGDVLPALLWGLGGAPEPP